MVSFKYSKHIKFIYIIFFSFFLHNCQIKESNRSHGINFLENRGNVLLVGKTNKNDVMKLIGSPHSTSIKGDTTWIYFERKTAKGKLIRLGQNILKENNILVLKFDKYGVLSSKKVLNKENMTKIKYTKNETANTVKKPGFVTGLLQSVRQKMYSQNKDK